MSFLTIEKFTPNYKTRIIKKLVLAIVLLVVPLVVLAAWAFLGMMTNSEFFLAQAAVGINKQINYQGKIANSSGNNLTDGNYSFKFELYDAPDAGTLLWSEEWKTGSGAGPVQLVDSVFSVALGTSTALTSSLFANDNLYLQVYLDADSNGVYEETFSPRKRITASPYAFNSDTLDGYDATTTATANKLLVLDGSAGLTLNSVTTTGSFYAGSYASSTGGLYSQGNGHFGGTLTVDGNATTSGHYYVGGDLTVDDNFYVLDSSNAAALYSLNPSLNFSFLASTTFTSLSNHTYSYTFNSYLDPSADSSYYHYNFLNAININSNNTKNIQALVADSNVVVHYGTGNLTYGYGQLSTVELAGLGNITTASGGWFEVASGVDVAAGNITNALGVMGKVNNDVYGGAITSAQAISGIINNDGGTITDAYGLRIYVPSGSGVINNDYGVYIENQNRGGSLNYNIYSAGTTGLNYFGGQVGIATTTPWSGYELAVTGDEVLTGNLKVLGYGQFNNVSTTDTLYVGGYASTTGGLYTQSNGWFGSAVTVGSKLGIATTTPWDSYELAITGDAILTGNLKVLGYGQFNNVSTTDTLYVGGYASTTGGLYTQGNGHFGGNLTVDNNATTTGYLTVGTAPTGATFSSGNLNIQNSLVVGGGITLGGVYRDTWPAGSVGSAGSFWATTSNSLIGYPDLSGFYAIVIGGSATTSNISNKLKLEVTGGDFGVDLTDETFFVDSTNNSVGIATTTPWSGYELAITGDEVLTGNLYGLGSATTSQSLYVGTQINVATSSPWSGYELALAGDAVVSGNFYNKGNATTTGSLYANEIFSAGTQLLGSGAASVDALSVIGLHSGYSANLAIYAKDSDGTDNVSIVAIGKNANDLANRELFSLGWNAAGTYDINTFAAGSGVVRDLRIYTGNNSTQLYLDSTGDVRIPDLNSTSSYIGNLTVYNNANFNSITTTDSLYVGGYASSTGGLFTKGNGHFGGNLTVDGNVTTTGIIDVQQYLWNSLADLSVQDGLSVSGNATTSGYLTVGTAPTGATFSSGNLNIQNSLVVGGGITLGGVYRDTWPAGGVGSAGSFWATTSNSLIGYPDLSGFYAIVIGGAATTSNISNNLKLEVTGGDFGVDLTDETFFVDSTNNSVGIATTTPWSGYELAITGDAVLTGNLKVLGYGQFNNVSTTDTLYVGGYASTTGGLYTQSNGWFGSAVTVGSKLGIATTTPWDSYELAITGDAVLTGNLKVLGYGQFNNVSTTDTLYVGGYASTTGGLYTQGLLRGGGGLTAEGTISLPSNSITDAMVVNTITASNYLPLTGGTLTGLLSGTSASFSNAVTSTKYIMIGSGTVNNLDYVGDLYVSDDVEIDGSLWVPNATTTNSLYAGSNISIGINPTPYYALSVLGSATTSGVSVVGTNVYVGYASGSDDDYLYFDAGNESLLWDNSPGEFVLSDDLQIQGNATTTGKLVVGNGTTVDNSGRYGIFSSSLESVAFPGGSYGLYASSTNTGPAGWAAGVFGKGAGTNSAVGAYGVFGEAIDYNVGYNYGVYGKAASAATTNYGVYGLASGASDYAGYFEGNLGVTATTTITKGLVVDTSSLFVNYDTNRVGVGTTTPSRPLSVVGQIFTSQDGSDPSLVSFGGMVVMDNSNGQGWYIAGRSQDTTGLRGSLKFDSCSDFDCGAGGTLNIMELTRSGRVGIATTTPQYRLQVGSIIGNTFFSVDSLGNATTSANLTVKNLPNQTTGSAANVFVDSNGLLFKSSSSLRYKTDINYGGVDGSILYQLQPVSFKDKNTGVDYIGFIAEDVALVEPRLVSYDASGNPDGLHYGNFSALITKAVQELSARVDALEVDGSADAASGGLPVVDSPGSNLDSLTVQQAANFYGTITVYGEAGFVSKVTFEKEVEFKDHLTVAGDTAGTAIITAGATSTEILFGKEYQEAPKVVANLQIKGAPIFVQWGIADKSTKGFRIVLAEPVLADLEFDWVALANKAGGQVAGEQEQAVVVGCTNPEATNYNPAATQDDGSCILQPAETPPADQAGSQDAAAPPVETPLPQSDNPAPTG
ncbi:MAG: tail fiber domain-containing protein [Patescibacteria group bacterium]